MFNLYVCSLHTVVYKLIHTHTHTHQVVEPCDITATYILKEDGEGVLEECVSVMFSELVISLTVEAMFSLLRPLSLVSQGQVRQIYTPHVPQWVQVAWANIATKITSLHGTGRVKEH